MPTLCSKNEWTTQSKFMAADIGFGCICKCHPLGGIVKIAVIVRLVGVVVGAVLGWVASFAAFFLTLAAACFLLLLG